MSCEQFHYCPNCDSTVPNLDAECDVLRGQVSNLAMLVRRLAVASEDLGLAENAIEYLTKQNLLGSPLRK